MIIRSFYKFKQEFLCLYEYINFGSLLSKNILSNERVEVYANIL